MPPPKKTSPVKGRGTPKGLASLRGAAGGVVHYNIHAGTMEAAVLWILEQVEQLNPAEVLACLPRLSAARRERVLAMKNEAAQVRSILAELLLRHALRTEYGRSDLPNVQTGEKGKPFFPDRPDLCFNLSHCKTAVACVLDRAPAGVDVQEVRPLRRKADFQSLPLAGKVAPALAPVAGDASACRNSCPPAVYRILSEPERAWVEAGETPAQQDRRFTAIWTCKEALGKARGEGLLYELNTTRFLPRSEPWQQYGFHFRQLALGQTLLTVCSGTELSPRFVTFADLITDPNTETEDFL